MLKDLNKLIFIFILGLAFYLRLHGITNGFPYIFHPDEPTIVRSALGIRFFPNPGHFDWPHLYIYFNYFVFMAFAKLRDIAVQLDLKTTLEGIFPLLWDDELIYYLITRVLTASLGALTVIPVYLTAKKLFGTKAGLMAGLAFALIPFHVRHTHYSLPDGPMVFLIAWSLYFSVKILQKDDANNYAGAGAYLGFSASTKYNGGLAALMIPLAHLMRTIKNKESIINMNSFLNLLVAVGVAIVAFILGTPYAVMDYKTFVRTDGPQGALWQFTNVGSVPTSERPIRFVSEMLSRVSDDLGYTFLAVFFITFIVLIIKAVLRRTLTIDYYAWFIFLYGTFLLAYVSGFGKPRSHYYMVAYPFIAVLFGYFCAFLYEKLEPKLKTGVFAIYVLLLIVPLYFSVKQAYIFGNPDTRNTLSLWLKSNISAGTHLVYSSDDFTPIMKEYEKQSEKGLDKAVKYTTGYVITTETSTQNDQSFGILKYGDKLQKVQTINNDYNNGPAIVIYRITR
ncbi:hypothetical protein GYA27_02225 [candidate division WWE3 bacterium]|uniref:Glycosyltransferase RgtA/B/C/D-like domain-containing protein n=1 Tax=candidate division WWE3 bacterium TaxID=2053526 RepID=A0A7X9HGK5_UNCKA|nr:hypothetical protein [candidate division WWE3 bacterium]